MSTENDAQALDKHIRNPPRRVLIAARVVTAIVLVPICTLAVAQYLKLSQLPSIPSAGRYAILVGAILGTVIGGWIGSRMMMPFTIHAIALLDFSIDFAYTTILARLRK